MRLNRREFFETGLSCAGPGARVPGRRRGKGWPKGVDLLMLLLPGPGLGVGLYL